MSVAIPFLAFLLAGMFAAYHRLRLAVWAAMTACLLLACWLLGASMAASVVAAVVVALIAVPLLVPGIGAQGGDVEASVRAGQTVEGTGIVVNSSRAIIYASGAEDFATAAGRAAQIARDQINRYRLATA